jgi:hypothetical protein
MPEEGGPAHVRAWLARAYRSIDSGSYPNGDAF